MTAAGFTPGHALSVAVLRRGGREHSRKPAPGSPDYDLLAHGADETGADGHFDLGLTALLDGSTRLARRPRRSRAPRPPRT